MFFYFCCYLLFFSLLFFFYWWMNTKAFFNNIYFPYSFLWTFIWTKKNIKKKLSYWVLCLLYVTLLFSVPVWHMENKRNLTLCLVFFLYFSIFLSVVACFKNRFLTVWTYFRLLFLFYFVNFNLSFYVLCLTTKR